MFSRAAALLVLVTALCLLAVSPSRAAEPAAFRAGAAAVDVTPREFPISMLGSLGDRKAASAHDPLQVRALVHDDGLTRLAIALCDSCAIPRDLFDRAKSLAAQRTRIPVERMLMAATHTHTAPAVIVLSDIPVDPRYTKLLAEGIAEAIARAASRLEPAKIGWAVESVPEEVSNRRWFMKEGAIPPNPFGHVDKVRTNPPSCSPDIVGPAGPTDPDVSVLSVQTAAGKPLALLANYSLHYVGDVPGGLLSADYFGEFSRQIQKRVAPGSGGGEFVGMLSNGTSGDVNNISFLRTRQPGPPFSRINAVAARVADAAEEAYRRIKHRDHITLAMAEREIGLGVRKPSPEELARAKDILAHPNDKSRSGLDRYYADSSVRLSRYPDTMKLKLQALRIGGVGVVAIPCEVFAETGLEIKRHSPLRPSFTIELANGCDGYLPTPEQHALGGYETWRATSSFLEVEASHKITATLMEMLAGVSRSGDPMRAEAAPKWLGP